LPGAIIAWHGRTGPPPRASLMRIRDKESSGSAKARGLLRHVPHHRDAASVRRRRGAAASARREGGRARSLRGASGFHLGDDLAGKFRRAPSHVDPAIN